MNLIQGSRMMDRLNHINHPPTPLSGLFGALLCATGVLYIVVGIVLH